MSQLSVAILNIDDLTVVILWCWYSSYQQQTVTLSTAWTQTSFNHPRMFEQNPPPKIKIQSQPSVCMYFMCRTHLKKNLWYHDNNDETSWHCQIMFLVAVYKISSISKISRHNKKRCALLTGPTMYVSSYYFITSHILKLNNLLPFLELFSKVKTHLQLYNESLRCSLIKFLFLVLNL